MASPDCSFFDKIVENNLQRIFILFFCLMPICYWFVAPKWQKLRCTSIFDRSTLLLHKREKKKRLFITNFFEPVHRHRGRLYSDYTRNTTINRPLIPLNFPYSLLLMMDEKIWKIAMYLFHKLFHYWIKKNKLFTINSRIFVNRAFVISFRNEKIKLWIYKQWGACKS